MKKVAFLLILFSCALCVSILNSFNQPVHSLLAAGLNPPPKVVEAAESIAQKKSNFFEVKYAKDGGYWTALIFNYFEDGAYMDIEQAQFKANGKRVD